MIESIATTYQNAQPAITAVITFHNEGVLGHYALLGFDRLRRVAEGNGVAVELIAVLDSATQETVDIISRHPVVRQTDQVLRVENADLASSRNDGVQKAHGKFIAILDGDDYYSSNWLVAALNKACSTDGECVIHPEITVSFGAFHCVAKTINDDWDDYPPESCLMVHPWISCSFGRREIYVRYPYQPTRVRDTGFGYEDWHWNLELKAHNVRHLTASQTALFYRRKASSMVTEMVRSGATIRPTKFFDEPQKWQSTKSEKTRTP